MRYAMLFLVLLAAGCTDPVRLYNPQTGQTAQCGPYPTGAGDAEGSAIREANCLADYRAQGFLRQP